MGKFVIVENDKVKGVDKHKISGPVAAPPPPTYTGVGDYEYNGKMAEQLSSFIRINGQPVAITSSKSALDPGEDVSGGHAGPQGKNLFPPAPEPEPTQLKIIDKPIGTGSPSATSGSTFVKSNGIAILLDGDKIDTCDGLGKPMNSSVTAGQQDFVSLS